MPSGRLTRPTNYMFTFHTVNRFFIGKFSQPKARFMGTCYVLSTNMFRLLKHLDNDDSDESISHVLFR